MKSQESQARYPGIITTGAKNTIIYTVGSFVIGLLIGLPLALMLGTARRLAWQTSELKQGRWSTRELILLTGKTLGVLGTGTQARLQVRQLAPLLKTREIVAWGRDRQRLEVYRADMAGVGFEVVAAESSLQLRRFLKASTVYQRQCAARALAGRGGHKPVAHRPSRAAPGAGA